MNAACNVVYVDRSARQERMVRRGEVLMEGAPELNDYEANESARKLQVNVQILLGTFNKVYVCPTGLSCLARIARLNNVPTASLVPTLVLIDIPEDDEENDQRTPLEQDEAPRLEAGAQGVYGSRLLREIVTDVKKKGVASLVIPVAVVAARRPRSMPSTPTKSSQGARPGLPWRMPSDAAVIELPQDQAPDIRFVDLGAIDVLDNPIRQESLPSLAIQLYRVHQEFLRRGQHLTAPTEKHQSPWPGTPTQEPFTYLREVMVADLAGEICGTIVDHPLDPVTIQISDARKRAVIDAVSVWGFSAHEFTDNELLYATLAMLEHALKVEGMEEFRIPSDALLTFVATSRNGYKNFVPYHNFRHVVDVLQAVFHLLVRIGALPPFPTGEPIAEESKSTTVGLLRPFEALTLLIAAIGHDVGHPGVNNMFLVKTRSPLARLYNDRSVLESYHAAVYCHMLKKLWPAVVDNEEMRILLVSCILSTDMGIHKVYMEKLSGLQEHMRTRGDKPVEGEDLKRFRDVACNLLIKCADISNVARPFNCAAAWTSMLTEEFARQGHMEKEIKLESTLFAPPARNMMELATSQTGFISFFALPLFLGVEELMPTTAFCVEEIRYNKELWEDKKREASAQVQEEKNTRDREGSDDSIGGNNPPAAESSAMGAARGQGGQSGGLKGGSGAASGGQPSGAASTHPDLDGTDVPPTLVRGQQPQSNSRPNSRPVTWDEASANSRPATGSSARRTLGMPEGGQMVAHRRSETTDGSASVPDSGGWEGSARTGDSGKSEEKTECMSTARTSVESSGMRGVNGVNGTKRKSLVGSVSTPDLRSDSKVRMRHVNDAARERKKAEKGDSVFASMRELTRRPSLGKFKFWKKREAGGFGGREMQPQPPMPNVMGRRGREGGVSVS